MRLYFRDKRVLFESENENTQQSKSNSSDTQNNGQEIEPFGMKDKLFKDILAKAEDSSNMLSADDLFKNIWNDIDGAKQKEAQETTKLQDIQNTLIDIKNSADTAVAQGSDMAQHVAGLSTQLSNTEKKS